MAELLFFCDQTLGWTIVVQCWWIIHQTGKHRQRRYFSGVAFFRAGIAFLGLQVGVSTGLMLADVEMPHDLIMYNALKLAVAVALLGFTLSRTEFIRALQKKDHPDV